MELNVPIAVEPGTNRVEVIPRNGVPRTESNPFYGLEYKARKFASLLKKKLKRDVPEVTGFLLFSNKNVDYKEVDDLRFQIRCSLIRDVINLLVNYDRNKARRQSLSPRDPLIRREVDALPKRPSFPKVIRDYRVTDHIGRLSSGVECYEAKLGEDGPARILKTIEVPLSPDDKIVKSAKAPLLKEHRALTRLADTGRVPRTSDPFLWDDKSLFVLPVERTPGKAISGFSKHSLPPSASIFKVLEEGFSALDDVHRAGVLHGAINPGAVHLLEDGRVLLSEFDGCLQLEGDRSGFPSGEISELGDVRNLARTLYRWVSGEDPGPAKIREQITDSRKDLLPDRIDALGRIFERALSLAETGNGTAKKLLDKIRKEKRFLEKRFFNLGGQFLSCPPKVEEVCSLRCQTYKEQKGNSPTKKEPVGAQWNDPIPHYNPPPEYLGEEYSGIVVAAFRPGTIRGGKDKQNRAVLEKTEIYKRSKAFDDALEMNRATGNFSKWWEGKDDIFYLRGMNLDARQVAIVNLFKCRTPNWYPRSPEILSWCMANYFCLQMRLLRPNLIIYAFPFLEEIGDKLLQAECAIVSFHHDSCYVREDVEPPEHPEDPEFCKRQISRFEEIQEKVGKALLKYKNGDRPWETEPEETFWETS
jgi:serine/threonine protein kinase